MSSEYPHYRQHGSCCRVYGWGLHPRVSRWVPWPIWGYGEVGSAMLPPWESAVVLGNLPGRLSPRLGLVYPSPFVVLCGGNQPCASVFSAAALIVERKAVRFAGRRMCSPLKLSCPYQTAFRFSGLSPSASVSKAPGTLDVSYLHLLLLSSSSFFFAPYPTSFHISLWKMYIYFNFLWIEHISTD